MKRIFHTILASFIFLTIISVVGYLAYFLEVTEFWIMFAIASGVLLVGIAICFFKHRSAKIVAFFINAVAMGLYLQSWYINRGFHNSIWLMLGVSALAVAYMLVFALPLYIPAVNRHYGVYLTIFILLSLAGYVCLIIFTKTTWVSTLGYYGILQLSFILGSSFDCNDFDDEITALLISSYSIVVCAVIIVTIAAGGECCDGCDCGGSGKDFSSPLKSGKKNKASPMLENTIDTK